MKIEKIALLALGTTMTSGAALASNTVDKATPNVLLILVDDLGLGVLQILIASLKLECVWITFMLIHPCLLLRVPHC